ncbi:ABC-2 type transport system permease protein [Caloranaerobacter azorensis DSM 13643]|uniref:Transport permease protein n=1 Tax=Caloranaerobacter azorensis DSM 13643 TaxID=1121264 RepID=A0A1M5T9G4_9FIRM|nr:ABC transporter permease [Caloranaerobacter azorensis]SHH47013.1 ABC-2 type transport system permease protein [Caloranaerobacter azorensis DSM 13643]
MKSWIAYWNILKKDMKNYYLKPPNISWGIIFPVAWTLMFFIKSQSTLGIRDILPGVMSMSILFGTTSMLAVTITFERKSRSFERLLLAPISLNLLMLSKTTGAIIFGVINAFIPVIFASLITDLTGINWILVFGSVLFIAITSTFLGLFIAVSVSEVFEAQTFSNFFRFPMIFLCGLFIPIQSLPVIVRPLSYILPLTYGTDILKSTINGTGFLPVWINFLILIGFALLLFSISIRNIKEKWIY